MYKKDNTEISDPGKLNKRIISTVFGLATLAQINPKSTSVVLKYIKDNFFLRRMLHVGIEPKEPLILLPPYDEDEVKNCEEEVKGLLKNKTVREKICFSLKPGVQDLFDTAKSLAPAFITLSATGVISISLSPLLLVVAAVLILKIGVENFCADQQQG